MILKEPQRVKWFLWHGNEFRADETLTDLMFEVDSAIEEDRGARRPAQLMLKKLVNTLEEFTTYIDNNASGIVNYGEFRRCGGTDIDGFCGINDQPTRGQAVSQEAADAVDTEWG